MVQLTALVRTNLKVSTCSERGLGFGGLCASGEGETKLAADLLQMVRAPAAGKSLPSASPAKAAAISDEEIERQLRALGVD